MVQWLQQRHWLWYRSYSPLTFVYSVMVSLLLVGSILPAPVMAASQARYTLERDTNGQQTISVTGAGAVVTLADIRQGLGNSAALLEDLGGGVWQLNANLLIERGVTLNVSSTAGVRELRLRSEQRTGNVVTARYDYSSFVYLRTNNGTITIDGVRVHSWDPAAGTFDTNITNGRSYILAKFAARLDIANAELSYLGSADGESYGVSWRDVNDPADPNTLLTRVTGEVINSTFQYNYYGIYTYQASKMVFRGNTFAHNISYGFDPHDFSHSFIVEDNQAFANGNHGFIISRGCTNFVFRRNVAFNNSNPDPVEQAHGFMLDPGSPSSSDPQVPSSDNLLEDNRAYGNEGYGLRLLGAPRNIIRNNMFENNEKGITVEEGSTDNVLMGNTLRGNTLYGIFVRRGADATMIMGNSVTNSGSHGIYVRSDRNTLLRNSVLDNGGDGISLLPESEQVAALDYITPELDAVGAAEQPITGTMIQENTVSRNAAIGIDLKGADSTSVMSNTVEYNQQHGVYLGQVVTNSRLFRNTLRHNQSYGIRASGAGVRNNTWSENSVYSNRAGGILVNDGANNGVAAPVISLIQGREVTGTAPAGATVEFFAAQGRDFVGRTTAQAGGRFRLTLAQEPFLLTAVATDSSGNSSSLANDAPARTETYAVHLPLVQR